jgi:hypothetical protein
MFVKLLLTMVHGSERPSSVHGSTDSYFKPKIEL